MTRLFWDLNATRAGQWWDLGFKDLFNFDPAAEPDEPFCFLLVHSSDLDKALALEDRKWTDAQAFARWALGIKERSALLLISGGNAALSPLARVMAESDLGLDERIKFFDEAVEDADQSFVDSLSEMLEEWQRASAGPPRWEILKGNWREEAVDYLTAVSLLLERDQELNEFLAETGGSSPLVGGRLQRGRVQYTLGGSEVDLLKSVLTLGLAEDVQRRRASIASALDLLGSLSGGSDR
jgi:hypothetical protein